MGTAQSSSCSPKGCGQDDEVQDPLVVRVCDPDGPYCLATAAGYVAQSACCSGNAPRGDEGPVVRILAVSPPEDDDHHYLPTREEAGSELARARPGGSWRQGGGSDDVAGWIQALHPVVDEFSQVSEQREERAIDDDVPSERTDALVSACLPEEVCWCDGCEVEDDESSVVRVKSLGLPEEYPSTEDIHGHANGHGVSSLQLQVVSGHLTGTPQAPAPAPPPTTDPQPSFVPGAYIPTSYVPGSLVPSTVAPVSFAPRSHVPAPSPGHAQHQVRHQASEQVSQLQVTQQTSCGTTCAPPPKYAQQERSPLQRAPLSVSSVWNRIISTSKAKTVGTPPSPSPWSLFDNSGFRPTGGTHNGLNSDLALAPIQEEENNENNPFRRLGSSISWSERMDPRPRREKENAGHQSQAQGHGQGHRPANRHLMPRWPAPRRKPRRPSVGGSSSTTSLASSSPTSSIIEGFSELSNVEGYPTSSEESMQQLTPEPLPAPRPRTQDGRGGTEKPSR